MQREDGPLIPDHREMWQAGKPLGACGSKVGQDTSNGSESEPSDDREAAPTKKRKATNVIDLVAALQESLKPSKASSSTSKKSKPAPKKHKPAKRQKAA